MSATGSRWLIDFVSWMEFRVSCIAGALVDRQSDFKAGSSGPLLAGRPIEPITRLLNKQRS